MPEFGAQQLIDFMVDTGATFTCIHPKDVLLLGLTYDLLKNKICVESGGGTVERRKVQAALSFRDSDDATVYGYDIPILVANPDDVGDELPSVLGQDILEHWRMVHDRSHNELAFRVYRADRHDLEDD